MDGWDLGRILVVWGVVLDWKRSCAGRMFFAA